MAAARGAQRGGGGQGPRRRPGGGHGPLRQDRARAALRRTELGRCEYAHNLGQTTALARVLGPYRSIFASMGRTLRLSEGRFGRLVLAELAAGDRLEAQADPVIVLQSRYDSVLFLNPGECHASTGPTRVLALHAGRDWLRSCFPAVFEADERHPFTQGVELITPRIRQLADALAVEVQNDRFLSPERL